MSFGSLQEINTILRQSKFDLVLLIVYQKSIFLSFM